ncbi:MAG: cytochrome c oxidase subunit 3 [Ilumatobacter sp.]|uniref:cytochrome c oxidase subunit 3 n=1 Tax=Ilumatobacter sp. TaxID=1967498 RepID=UPI00260828AA|nr:cytochrome c oxidase subunit 3 [Ilumatobacter sp.]MDJ0770298.1 cytochrome c oxidase subunit 3 [Ilumatobacter sp.]
MTTPSATVALPAAAPPAPRRQLFVATALACVAASTLVGGMLAIWVLLRERVVDAGERFPVDYIIPEVASNVMLMTIWALCLFAQWAVYSGNRGDRAHTGLALAVTGILAIAYINAQAFVYVDMAVPIRDDYYGALFYAMTGTMTALVIAGLVYTTVAAFRALGGRLQETEILSAHALYWYFAATAYSAVWFVVYVTK